MDTMGIARCLVGVEPEIMARVQFDLVIGKGSDPQFGTLQVNQYRRWPVICFFQRADIGNQLRLVGLIAMAHVDAESIRARAEQFFDHLGRIACRAQSCQYADLAHAWFMILHQNGSAIWILNVAPPITRQVSNEKGACLCNITYKYQTQPPPPHFAASLRICSTGMMRRIST